METKSKAEQKYRHSDRVSWRQVDKEGVILDLESSDYFSVNEVGVFIWEKLGAGETPKEIALAICEEYEVSEEQAQKDVLALIKELLKRKLIEPKE